MRKRTEEEEEKTVRGMRRRGEVVSDKVREIENYKEKKTSKGDKEHEEEMNDEEEEECRKVEETSR